MVDSDSENINTEQLIKNINDSLKSFNNNIKEGNKAFINVSAQINKIAAKFVYDSKLSDQISKQKSTENRIRQRERVYLEKYHSEQVRRNKQFGKSIMNMNEKFNFVTQSLTKGRGIGATMGVLTKNIFNSSKEFYKLELAQKEYAEALLDPSNKVNIDTKKEALTGAEEGVKGTNKQLAFLSKKLAKAGDFFSKHSTGIILGAGVAGVLVGVIIKAMSIAPMFQAMLKLMKFAVMMILMPIGTFFGAIIKPFMVGFIKVLAPEFKKWMETSMKIGSMIGDALFGFKLDSVTSILSAMMPLIPIIPMILSALKPTIDGLTKLDWNSITGGVMVVVDAFTKLGSQIGIPSVIDAFGEVVSSFSNIFSEPELITKIGANITGFVAQVTEIFSDSGFIKSIGVNIAGFMTQVKEIFSDSVFIQGIGTTIITFMTQVKEIFSDTESMKQIGINFTNFMGDIKTFFEDTELIANLGVAITTFSSIMTKIFSIPKEIKELRTKINGFVDEMKKIFITIIPNAIQGFVTEFVKFWSGLYTTIVAAFTGIPVIGTWIKENLEQAKKNMSGAPSEAEDIKADLSAAETSISTVPPNAASVASNFSTARNRLQGAPIEADRITELLKGITERFAGTFAWIKDALKQVSKMTEVKMRGDTKVRVSTPEAKIAQATLRNIGSAGFTPSGNSVISVGRSKITDMNPYATSVVGKNISDFLPTTQIQKKLKSEADRAQIIMDKIMGNKGAKFDDGIDNKRSKIKISAAGQKILDSAKSFAKGGIINEPVFGIGASGQQYLMGENGSEYVIPANQVSNNKSININIHIDKIEKDADFNKLKPMIQRWILEANSRRGMI